MGFITNTDLSKMKIKEIKLYSYEELSEEAKLKALEDFNENNHFDFLEEDLTEYLKILLEKQGIKPENLKILYNFSYSQGDFFDFEGDFQYNLVNLYIRNGEILADEDEDDTSLKAYVIESIKRDFEEIYNILCKEMKEEGYSRIEYEQSEENFKEICEANEYTFTEDGT